MSNKEAESHNKEIRLINFKSYVRPKVEERQGEEWVLNGQNNSFYKYIINRYNGSPTNAAIINSYIDLIYGQGLSPQRGSAALSQWVKFVSMMSAEDVKRIVADFELYGECAMQIIPSKGSKELPKIHHIAKETVVPNKANDDNEIEGYWYSPDWANSKKEKNKPEYFSAFGSEGSDKKATIYVVKPYKAGKRYFNDPDYLAGLPYCDMEEEIANYYVSHIKNGLSFGYIINIPDGNSYSETEKDDIERKIKTKLTGSSNAGKFVLSFNGRDAEITVTPLQVNSAHKQWEYLTQEARQQIMTAHRVTSPMLFGIKDSTGFGNNADEMDMAEAQLMKRVIKPKQRYITDAIEIVLEYFGVVIGLEFKPLTEVQETGSNLELSADEEPKPTEVLADRLIELGSDGLDGYDLLCSSEVEYDTDDEVYTYIKFASTGTARPNAKSSQDSEEIKIRYRYSGNKEPQREFCRKMMSANKLYRKEDILQMGNKTVNEGFGMSPTPNKPYSIWLWKGGGKISESHPNGTCRHFWQREIYLKQGGGVDVNSPLAKTITTAEARRKGYKVPTNPSAVAREPNKNKA